MMKGNKIGKLIGGLFFILPLTFMLSCGGAGNSGKEASNSSGKMQISVDETLRPVISEEVEVFEADYPDADIIPRYVSEQEAIRDLMRDSSMAIVVTRKLTESETDQFVEKYKVMPSTYQIAVDAVALIVNKSNKDSLLTEDEVKSIFSGKVTKWSQLGDKANDKEIEIVFDDPNSSTLRAIKKYVGLEKLDSSRVFAANTNPEVIEYVKNNPGALGIIGVNWVSHAQDSTAQAFLADINMVGIAPSKGEPGYGKYYKPYQAYLKQGVYPIRRDVFIINGGQPVSLGTGFALFVSGERGQLIILRSGLLPSRAPVRLINIQ